MRYPALRGCIVHDMNYGEIEDNRIPGDPLAVIEAELMEQDGPTVYTCTGIIYLPMDGKCGEVFVLIPDEIRDQVRVIMEVEAEKVKEAARTRLKVNLKRRILNN